jgi:hypothetical protein
MQRQGKGRSRFPSGNDRQKGKSKSNGKSRSFALLRMTKFVVVLAAGSCFARFWFAGFCGNPPKAQKQERAVGGAPG